LSHSLLHFFSLSLSQKDVTLIKFNWEKEHEPFYSLGGRIFFPEKINCGPSCFSLCLSVCYVWTVKLRRRKVRKEKKKGNFSSFLAENVLYF
jgi:hypothetical protein